jgi:hypothetical protein
MMPRGISSIWAGFLGLGLVVTGCNLVAGLEGFHVTGGGGQGGMSAVTTGGGQGGTGATGGHGGAGGATTGTTSTGMMVCDECPEPPDCKIATCENMACGIASAPDGSVAKSQVVGDCKKSVCMGGVAMNVNDDMDPPEIAGDCKVHTCMSGGIVIAFEPMSTPCGVGGNTVCDGNGQCFGCTKPEDCVDLGACQKPSCDNGICGSQADATDVALDSNDCTLDLCTGPVPNHPSAMAGTACNGGASACDGAGHCLGYGCSGNDCPSGATCVDGVCCDTPCDKPCEACTKVAKGGSGLDGVCEPVAKGLDPTSECADPEVCDGTVGAGACKSPPGKLCALPSECASGFCVDGVCCESDCSGVCQSCNLPGSVGTCAKIAEGQDPAGECPGAVVCNGTGACGDLHGDGTACGSGPECQNGHCVDGVCCNSACTGPCVACNIPGLLGTCTNLAAGSDASDAECPGATVACDGAGACKQVNGQLCVGGGDCISGACADGVCCTTACGGICQACNLPGSVGTCANIPNGQDPNNDCPGASSCNGAGACLSPNGTACGAAAACQSGFCVDGVCCDGACGGLCQACSVAKKGQGLEGACGPVALGLDPNNQCADQGAPSCGTDGKCDGNGACHKYAGGAFVPMSFSTGGATGASIQLADLNGDGKLDVIAAKAGTPQVRVLLNNGAGGLMAASGYGTNASNQGDPIVIGDLNGDGKPDLVVPDITGASVKVLLNNGNGGFPSSNSYATGAGTLGLPLIEADLNGDGKPDLVATDTGSAQVRVLLNNGNGGFSNGVTYPTNVQSLIGPIAAGDLNGDGKPDLVALDLNGKVRILLNNGSGAFPSSTSYPTNASGLGQNMMAALVNMNLDGKLDLVINDSGTSQVRVMLNNGSGAFPSTMAYPASLLNSGVPFTFGDVNGDLQIDLIYGLTNGTTAYVMLNNLNGGFAPAVSYSATQTPGRPLVLSDVSGDGHPDLVFTIPSSPSVGVMLNNGNGTFKNGTLYPTLGGNTGLTLQVGDMNGDGRPDLVTTDLSNPKVTILTNICQ